MADDKPTRGRPAMEGGRTVKTLLDPETYAAWKADGRHLNAILRAALLGKS